MHTITRRPTFVLIFIPLFFLMALASACGVIDVEDQAATTPLPPAATTTTSTTDTTAPVPTNTLLPAATSATAETASAPTVAPTANAPLAVVPAGTVELSVLVDPLDVGYVEVVGSLRLSNGQATEVHKNDQINLIARPVDPEQWRFDRWGGDLQGAFASDALVMDSSKKIRAIFVRVDDRTQAPLSFYQVTVNGQSVRNLIIGVDNGSVEVSPAPGSGQNPFREGTIVSLTPRPDDGYELADWDGDCGGSGSCVLTINDHKEVTISFQIKRYSLTVMAQPAEGGKVNPAGSTEHDYGDRVSITTQDSPGYEFAGFSGDCSGTGSCSLLMDSVRNVTANFKKIIIKNFSLHTAVSPVGSGSVSPTGIHEYPDGKQVSVTAIPAAGYTFTGWSGDCSGDGSCSVTMNADMGVTAFFIAIAVAPDHTPEAPTPGGSDSPTPTPTPAHTPTPTPGLALPPLPEGLGATTPAVGSVQLVWNDNSALETRFEIDHFGNITTESANANSHLFTGLASGVSQHFKIRACEVDPISWTGLVQN